MEEKKLIVDDVGSIGKAVFTLLKNLYYYNYIDETTIVNVNCIYCIEERYKDLKKDKKIYIEH